MIDMTTLVKIAVQDHPPQSQVNKTYATLHHFCATHYAINYLIPIIEGRPDNIKKWSFSDISLRNKKLSAHFCSFLNVSNNHQKISKEMVRIICQATDANKEKTLWESRSVSRLCGFQSELCPGVHLCSQSIKIVRNADVCFIFSRKL
ncbi:hypothetical protein CEXT_459311 [Caerostris extrusa]|uniref:Uncharacterized protein n=1 Tax=Caerostris extrusa TaxID=172846 RepID=A0AAV4QC87_CAEEX|nr:hypothetical protein CEXT_459311 [Caerostris extrusa]